MAQKQAIIRISSGRGIQTVSHGLTDGCYERRREDGLRCEILDKLYKEELTTIANISTNALTRETLSPPKVYIKSSLLEPSRRLTTD